jgi:hypothetical protein
MERVFVCPNGCWWWLGGTSKPEGQGYGRILRVDRRCMMAAHRFIYELLIGPVPAGMQLDHTCENTLCVSPHHLEPVTNDENQRRKWARNGGASAFEAYQQQCDDERQQLAGRSIEDDLVDAFD